MIVAKILVVDDEPNNRLLAVTILRHGGHDVIEAENAAQALARLADAPDLVLVDLFLPGVSGAELIGRIRRSEQSGVRLVLFTASSVDAAMRDFMEMHDIAHVIVKPAEPADFLAAVDAALRRT